MRWQWIRNRNIKIILIAALALAGDGCYRAVNLQSDDVEQALGALSEAGYKARQDGLLPADPNDAGARKAALKAVLIDPLHQLGLDPDLSIQRLANAYLTGKVPPDQQEMVVGLLKTYKSSRPDLVRFGFISQASSDLLEQI